MTDRCNCDAFNEAVNEEMIFWDNASETESASWKMDTQLCSGGEAMQVNFCPFCGKLPPLSMYFTGDSQPSREST